MNDLTEVRCSVITNTKCYHDITFYRFEGITVNDILEQLHAQGIFGITGILEY